MCKFCRLRSIFSNSFSKEKHLGKRSRIFYRNEKNLSFAIEQISHLEKERVEGNGPHQG